MAEPNQPTPPSTPDKAPGAAPTSPEARPPASPTGAAAGPATPARPAAGAPPTGAAPAPGTRPPRTGGGRTGGRRDGAPGSDGPAPAARDGNLSLDPNEVERPKIIKAKGSKNVYTGVVHILSTFNNTSVTVTDLRGNVIGTSSAGKVGFKGSRKSTAYAAQLAAQDACRQAMGHGLKEVEVRVKGPGAGRESAARAVQAIGLEITIIRDVTPVPHNGCRPPKPRRV